MIVDIKWGARWGLLGGVITGCITAVILVFAEDLPAGVTAPRVVLSYPIAGLIAGVLTGLVRPLLTSRRNAAIIGAGIGIVVAACMPAGETSA